MKISIDDTDVMPILADSEDDEPDKRFQWHKRFDQLAEDSSLTNPMPRAQVTSPEAIGIGRDLKLLVARGPESAKSMSESEYEGI